MSHIKVSGTMLHTASGRNVPFNVLVKPGNGSARWHGQISLAPGHWIGLGDGTVDGADEEHLRVHALAAFQKLFQQADLDEPGAVET